MNPGFRAARRDNSARLENDRAQGAWRKSRPNVTPRPPFWPTTSGGSWPAKPILARPAGSLERAWRWCRYETSWSPRHWATVAVSLAGCHRRLGQLRDSAPNRRARLRPNGAQRNEGQAGGRRCATRGSAAINRPLCTVWPDEGARGRRWSGLALVCPGRAAFWRPPRTRGTQPHPLRQLAPPCLDSGRNICGRGLTPGKGPGPRVPLLSGWKLSPGHRDLRRSHQSGTGRKVIACRLPVPRHGGRPLPGTRRPACSR